MENATIPISQVVTTIHHDQDMAGVLLVLVVITFGTRMYVRKYITKQVGIQDWAMVVTVLLAVAHMVVVTANGSVAIKQLQGDRFLARIHARLSSAMGTTFVLTLATLKISVGYFLLYIFSYERCHRIWIYTIMILSTLLGLAYVPIGYFTCAQIKQFPDLNNQCPQKVQQSAFVLLVMFSIVNIIGDFGFCIIGCIAMWHARLPRLTKISASVLLCLGCVGGIASVVRLYIYLAPASISQWSQKIDLLIRWMLIEVGSSVVAANLALTKPLFQLLVVKLRLLDEIDPGVGAAPCLSKCAQPPASSARRLLLNDNNGMTNIRLTEEDIAEFCRPGVSGPKKPDGRKDSHVQNPDDR